MKKITSWFKSTYTPFERIALMVMVLILIIQIFIKDNIYLDLTFYIFALLFLTESIGLSLAYPLSKKRLDALDILIYSFLSTVSVVNITAIFITKELLEKRTIELFLCGLIFSLLMSLFFQLIYSLYKKRQYNKPF